MLGISGVSLLASRVRNMERSTQLHHPVPLASPHKLALCWYKITSEALKVGKKVSLFAVVISSYKLKNKRKKLRVRVFCMWERHPSMPAIWSWVNKERTKNRKRGRGLPQTAEAKVRTLARG